MRFTIKLKLAATFAVLIAMMGVVVFVGVSRMAVLNTAITNLIQGPAARDFAAVFLETLRDTCKVDRPLFAAAEPAGDVPVRVLQLDLRERVGELDFALADLAAGAQERLLMSTPYLMPPAPILEAALAAARRGVDVRLLTCGRSDVPLVQYAGRRLYPILLEAGVRVWEHERDILHAKFFVADGRRTIIGSYNADRWGQRYNQEVAAEMESEELAAGLAECFRRGATVEITRETIEAWPWYVMFFARLLWILSKILAPDASHRARVGAEGGRSGGSGGSGESRESGGSGESGDSGESGERGEGPTSEAGKGKG